MANLTQILSQLQALTNTVNAITANAKTTLELDTSTSFDSGEYVMIWDSSKIQKIDKDNFKLDADNIDYDNTTSVLTATNVNDAVDEVVSLVGGIKTISKSVNYTLLSSDDTVITSISGGSIIMNLPTAASAYDGTTKIGKIYTIKRDATDSVSAFVVSIEPNLAELIDGKDNLIVEIGESIRIQSNGTSWDIISVKRAIIRTLVYNLPVNGVTSSDYTWIGEQRVESSLETGTYTTDFGCNNQHCALDVTSITGSGVVVFTGVSMSESSGLPTVTTESVTVDATGKYQTSKKWLEVTNIEIPAGITVISYNIGVLGYLDMLNTDFKVIGMRVDMTSSGVNSDISLKILKVQDDGSKKISIVEIEHYGIDASTKAIVDDLRTGGDDRSYTATSTIWSANENACLKQSDYDTYFTSDENIIESSTKGEGIIISLEGTASGAINNVEMLNLHLTIEMI